jgi:hypothetical protein
MARNVKLKKAKPAIARPTIAIAVTGRCIKGWRDFTALKNTPKMAPATKIGYFETVFQKLCMSFNHLRYLLESPGDDLSLILENKVSAGTDSVALSKRANPKKLA